MSNSQRHFKKIAGLMLIAMLLGPCFRSHLLYHSRYIAPAKSGSITTLPQCQPLITAIKKADIDEVRRLLDSGVSPNSIASVPANSPDPEASSECSHTALMSAAGEGNLEITRLLLDHGADINAYAFWGQTALLEAAVDGHPDVVKLLIARGADVNADDDGATALGYVRHHLDFDCNIREERRRYEEVARLLDGAGGTEWPFLFGW